METLKDELAKEQGFVICPLSHETYIHCDKKCKTCELYIDLKISSENKEGEFQHGR